MSRKATPIKKGFLSLRIRKIDLSPQGATPLVARDEVIQIVGAEPFSFGNHVHILRASADARIVSIISLPRFPRFVK